MKQTFRASEIVNNLLNFSRTGAAELAEYQCEPGGGRDAVAGGASLEDVADTGHAAIWRDIAAVRGSANKLQQVFLNLFLNARDAMPGGGMLEMRTAAHNGIVEVEIADTGSGHSAGTHSSDLRSFLYHQSERDAAPAWDFR